ncbi:uncharacterized protein EDB93DRAFT_1237560 [Suillus bovinus]|uniref:uncharacterized protein n=1 Tax=Suillus bovinus TaxID=48563 RepID=UPI001B8833C6|nr:uncharacterized protein EDB93DRAFT_1237560 [Suillus bovinus]KAG2159432.1 hypothetical protein EDB93DRAFT_1237560 [Suillus bovinus]
MFTLTRTAKLVVSPLKKLRMMVGHNLGIILNLYQMLDGRCVRGRLNLKDIGDIKRKMARIHVLPLKMHKEEWDLAQWLIKNVGQTWTEEFLKLPITQNRTKLSFHNNRSFLQKIDELPHGPGQSCRKITVCSNLEDENGALLQEELELWSRDPVECVKELIGNPFFKEDMAYSPARAYADRTGQHRVIDKMWTADWWGETQKALPKGAMIALIILLLDKTSLLQFKEDKSAWSVYMSIGNITKAKRCQASARATLECFTSDARSLAGCRLFHHCMALFLHTLIAAGQNRVKMMCVDSLVCHVYPILAAYCLVSYCKENWCPKCLVAANERGNGFESAMRDPESTKDILERRNIGQHPPEFEENGLRAVYKPFWAEMPHANIFLAFTPNLLHQIYKGVFKDHLMKWCINIIREDVMDARFKAIPDYPGLCHFKKGILTVKQWTGSEHKEMHHVLVVVQSILDLFYYAWLQIHTTDMLKALQTALGVFHVNKDVLKELAIREHFNIPKLHQLTHYVQSIMLFGAADGFNTELPERLHIDFAKDTYCHTEHHSFNSDLDLEEKEAASPNLNTMTTGHTLAKVLAHPHQTVEKIVTAHGAIDFLSALQTFLCKNLPHITIVPGIHDHFNIYRQVVIEAPPDQRVSNTPNRWHVRARPEVVASGCKPGCPACFDMALISDGPRSLPLHTLEGVQVAQVRAIPFRHPDPSSRLQQVSCLTRQLHRNAAVIHVDEIVQPCHLIPKMGQSVDMTLRSGNAYEAANDFYFNQFIDGEIFGMSVINSL